VRIVALTVSLLTLAAGIALAAAGGKTLHHTSTFKLAAGRTKEFSVAYPDALEFGGATYAGRVRILGPSASERGSAPALDKVHITSQGSTLGDSQYSARVKNANRAGTAPVRVLITATTTLPAGTGRG
jgi:hypothetical protein